MKNITTFIYNIILFFYINLYIYFLIRSNKNIILTYRVLKKIYILTKSKFAQFQNNQSTSNKSMTNSTTWKNLHGIIFHFPTKNVTSFYKKKLNEKKMHILNISRCIIRVGHWNMLIVRDTRPDLTNNKSMQYVSGRSSRMQQDWDLYMESCVKSLWWKIEGFSSKRWENFSGNALLRREMDGGLVAW